MRTYFVMLALGCLVVMSVYAAEQNATEPASARKGEANTPAEPAGAKAVTLATDLEKVSYSIGAQIGQNFKRQAIEINLDVMVQGIKDALAGGQLALGEDEMRQIMSDFMQRNMAKMQELRKAEAGKNLAEGNAFLEANKSKPGVKVLPSGLQYRVIREGTGKTPTANDRVKTNYAGRLIDGTEFDSSYKRGEPAEFAVKGVIPGWTEALQLMKEGGKWELYIPANIAYGERGNRGIPPNSTLVFDIELLAVTPGKPAPARAPAPPPGMPRMPRK